MVGFNNVEVDQLQHLRDVRLIDVRTDAEVRGGIIPGAIHIPLHLIPVKAHELDAAVPTVIYCRSGGRSAQACGFLAAKGWSDVSNLAGGIMAWVAAGRETVQPG